MQYKAIQEFCAWFTGRAAKAVKIASVTAERKSDYMSHTLIIADVDNKRYIVNVDFEQQQTL